MTVIARYDGEGVFQDTDEHSHTNEHPNGYVPNGGTFKTTKVRFGQLVEQGYAVTDVTPEDAAPAATPSKPAPAAKAKENS